MNVLHLLAWIIGACNPLSAILVGPALTQWLVRHGMARWTPWTQGTGWLVLAAAQVSFLGFGWLTGYGGFKWAQALMIPAALLNLTAGIIARRRERDPVAAMLYAIRYAEGLGRVHVERLPLADPMTATIGRLADQEVTVTGMRLTPLDEDGKPTGEPVQIQGTGRATISFQFEDSAEIRSVLAGGGWPDEEPDAEGRHAMTEETRERAMSRQCPEGVHSLSLSAPERCALEEGHEGACEP